MSILDILTAPWAIQPEKLEEMKAIYNAHMRGDKIDFKSIQSKMGMMDGSSDNGLGYDNQNGVAVIPVNGVLTKRASFFQMLFGGSSTDDITQAFKTAMQDPSVNAVLLHVDSPGGSVSGAQSLAQTIKASRGTKPIATLASGVMASAAYWIGSAADERYIADGTTAVGSIGVIMNHRDTTAADAKNGVKNTPIYAGKYKAVGDGSLTDEDKATLQAQVDYLYSVFVNDVAANLDCDPDEVNEDMADGRVFFGQQAVDAGLVDGVSTLDALIAKLSGGAVSTSTDKTQRPGVGQTASIRATSTQPTPQEETAMDLNTIKAQHPELYAAILAEGNTAGAQAEAKRIADIEALALPGHDALIKEMKADSKCSPADAAVKLIAAEKQKSSNALQALKDDAAKVKATASVVDTGEQDVTKAKQAAAGTNLTPEAKWDADEKLRAEFRDDKKRYLAFVAAEAKGNAMILHSVKGGK